MPLEKIEFLGTDGVKLEGFWMHKEIPSKKILIAIHGMSSYCFKKRDQIIAKQLEEAGIDFFGFDNRGNHLMTYIEKQVAGKVERHLAGTSFEDVLDSYYDITGALEKVIQMGYEEIYLQGHSLGCTKIIYTYHRLKKEKKQAWLSKIKAVVLLSLVDIPHMLEWVLGKESYQKAIQLAENFRSTGQEGAFMPKEVFMHPISVKTFLRYFKENEQINFARYQEEGYTFPELNGIDCPLFMRWGNQKELIATGAGELVEKMRGKIVNSKKDIDFIEEADHSYHGKEELLAKQIAKFLQEK